MLRNLQFMFLGSKHFSRCTHRIAHTQSTQNTHTHTHTHTHTRTHTHTQTHTHIHTHLHARTCTHTHTSCVRTKIKCVLRACCCAGHEQHLHVSQVLFDKCSCEKMFRTGPNCISAMFFCAHSVIAMFNLLFLCSKRLTKWPSLLNPHRHGHSLANEANIIISKMVRLQQLRRN